MAEKIKIITPHVVMEAELNDSKTAQKLLDILPCESSAQRWGDEVYFEIPLSMRADDAKAQVPNGAIAYWPDGKCFCIFFGQTPYSPVNVLGALSGQPDEFAKVKSGETVKLERVE